MDFGLTKQELRAIYKEKRMALSQNEVNFLSEKIFKQFILQFNIAENQRVNIFLPIKKFNEINTWIFIDYFFEKNIRVFVPKIRDKNLVSLEIFPDSEFEINHWGISEPINNSSYNGIFDYIITPLLYCDSSGNRIGYGKGFYDRFFEINKNVKKIGLNYFKPKEKITDISGFDIPLDGLIIPDKYYSYYK